jgi:hypothetical protein
VNIVLVPGLWLDGQSWNEVVTPLEAPGHTAHPMTLPGMESPEADRSGITLRDRVDAVIEVVDKLPDLPTGRWPQFTRPADLAEAILTAVER